MARTLTWRKQKIAGDTAVALQTITSNADVSRYAIEGATYTTIAKTQIQAEAQLKNTQLSVVGSQVGALMKNSRHFNSDLTAITPLLTAELGNTGASIAASQTKSNADNANAQKVGSIVSG
jgi:cation transporter-like permease